MRKRLKESCAFPRMASFGATNNVWLQASATLRGRNRTRQLEQKSRDQRICSLIQQEPLEGKKLGHGEVFLVRCGKSLIGLAL
jgi:hypothetical protein